MNKFEISIVENTDKNLSINDYERIKESINDFAKKYTGKTYTDSRDALKDEEELKEVKNYLKDIQNGYKKPYEEIDKQFEKLLAIIQEPLSEINKYKKNLINNTKKQEIISYAESISSNFGDIGSKIINSPKFIENDWLKSEYKDKKLKDAISNKLISISQDIATIKNSAEDNLNQLLAVYIETLSMDSVKNFSKNIMGETNLNEFNKLFDDDEVKGYKVIKVYGTQSQMTQVYDELELLGLDYDEIEDGMPKELEELDKPDFDSFVAFDIEHSGTNGIKYGDGPAEITEIGAVKVENGKIVSTFDMLANPGRKITKRNEELTRITNEMVKEKPPVSEVIRAFKDYCDGYVLVGHNIKSVDLPFITRAGRKNGIAFENKFFDTYVYAKKFKDKNKWDNVKLEYLAGQYGINDPGHHRADNDARVNVDVYFKLKEETK